MPRTIEAIEYDTIKEILRLCDGEYDQKKVNKLSALIRTALADAVRASVPAPTFFGDEAGDREQEREIIEYQAKGWNDCRSEMLRAADKIEKGEE